MRISRNSYVERQRKVTMGQILSGLTVTLHTSKPWLTQPTPAPTPGNLESFENRESICRLKRSPKGKGSLLQPTPSPNIKRQDQLLRTNLPKPMSEKARQDSCIPQRDSGLVMMFCVSF